MITRSPAPSVLPPLPGKIAPGDTSDWSIWVKKPRTVSVAFVDVNIKINFPSSVTWDKNIRSTRQRCRLIRIFPGYNTVALTYEELDGFVNDHCYKDADSLKWKCTLCDQTSLYKTDVVRHIEAKHVTLPELVCNVCGKTSKTRDSLRKHLSRNHNQYWRQKLVTRGYSLSHEEMDQKIDLDVNSIRNGLAKCKCPSEVRY